MIRVVYFDTDGWYDCIVCWVNGCEYVYVVCYTNDGGLGHVLLIFMYRVLG